MHRQHHPLIHSTSCVHWCLGVRRSPPPTSEGFVVPATSLFPSCSILVVALASHTYVVHMCVHTPPLHSTLLHAPHVPRPTSVLHPPSSVMGLLPSLEPLRERFAHAATPRGAPRSTRSRAARPALPLLLLVALSSVAGQVQYTSESVAGTSGTCASSVPSVTGAAALSTALMLPQEMSREPAVKLPTCQRQREVANSCAECQRNHIPVARPRHKLARLPRH